MDRTGTRTVVAVLVALTPFVGPAGVTASTCWRPPVDAPIADPFRAPPCRWCAGNRGIEYATRPGQPVHAVEAGRVTYSGDVTGVAYVVVQHADGRRVTYGRLATRRRHTGDVVLRGQVVGTAGEHFHLGVRVGDEYVDPAPRIGRLVGVPRLVPVDGSPPAPAPPSRLVCGPPAFGPRRDLPRPGAIAIRPR